MVMMIVQMEKMNIKIIHVHSIFPIDLNVIMEHDVLVDHYSSMRL
jgi:hypothetical protein